MYKTLSECVPDFMLDDLAGFTKELEAHLDKTTIDQFNRQGLCLLLYHYINGHSVPEIIGILVNGHGDPSAMSQQKYAALVQEAQSILNRTISTS